MTKQTQWLKQALQLCAEVGQEDGIDPRLLNQHHRKHAVSRKALQLSKEAQRSLSLSLAGEIQDPVLKDLQIVDVSPINNEQFLLVTVRADEGNASEILQHLRLAQGYLRSIIAQSIHRKRVPELQFNVLLKH